MEKLTSVYVRGTLNIVLQNRNGQSDLFHGNKKKKRKKTCGIITALKMNIF